MNKKEIRKALALWYERNKRILPWRDTKDPYAIWISEIILQQTRVAQGYDYYLRFMERFPNVQTLAEAQEDEILRLWQGLGYYSRARNLHAAAQQIMAKHKGVFPDSPADVRHLKGIGDYTTAAICSFAYNIPIAVVDGNVYRVLARLTACEIPIDTTVGKKHYAQLAQELLDQQNAALHNQAMMELGALQCVPGTPDCTQCPLSTWCESAEKDTASLLPIKEKKTKVRIRYFHYIRFIVGDTFYLQKRTAKDIWQHLYEYPLIETEEPLDTASLLTHPFFLNWTEGNSNICIIQQTGIRKHVLSHQHILAQLTEVRLDKETPALAKLIGVRPKTADMYAVPRIIELLNNDIKLNQP